MATPKDTVWEIEPHTLAKHKILERYLKAWFPILSTYHERIIYLDGFSGPGRYKNGEPGSPIIALEVANGHQKQFKGELVFIFVDERKDRVDNLKNEIALLKLPNTFKVHPEDGQFAQVATGILDEIEKENQTLAPTFAFIDPFGFSGVPFDLLCRLLKHKSSEALITFMVDSMNRFLEAPNEEIQKHIVEFFGTKEVIDVAKKQGDRIKNLLNFYLEKLQPIGKFIRLFEMRNQNDRIIYYLVFVTNNPLGHLRMKEAMWKVDEEGDFRYSDSTNIDQGVLFHIDHAEKLFNIMCGLFSKRAISVEALKNYIRDHTMYIDKHLTCSLQYGEEKGLITVNAQKMDGSKRRKKTFPDGALITFN
ncbi:MAG: three-Cys-motif partner protein TcmP [Bacteroidota bacterium]